MSIKLKVFATVVAVALAVVASVVSGPAVQASTAACGVACTTPSNEYAGTGDSLTISFSSKSSSCGTVTAAALNGGQCGPSVGLLASSATDPAQDWEVLEEGSVSTFVTFGALSSKLDIQYGGEEAGGSSADSVVEFEAVPDGVASDQCLAYTGSSTVTLQQCGTVDSYGTSTGSGTNSPTNALTGSTNTNTSTDVSTTYSPTAWILDQANDSDGFEDVISGYSQTYSDPLVLNVATCSCVSPSVGTAPFRTVDGAVSANQMWSFAYGGQSAAVVKHASMKHT